MGGGGCGECGEFLFLNSPIFFLKRGIGELFFFEFPHVRGNFVGEPLSVTLYVFVGGLWVWLCGVVVCLGGLDVDDVMSWCVWWLWCCGIMVPKLVHTVWYIQDCKFPSRLFQVC